MDVALILHADHGMNASTFATLVVASTLSDIYLSVGAGIAALHGPLHGGANEEVIRTLMKIGEAKRVNPWLDEVLARKGRVPGFGHRVYKAYDPRARILGPLAEISGRAKAAGQKAALRHCAGSGKGNEFATRRREEDLSQRGFFLGHCLQLPGYCPGHVYHHVCGEPNCRMDGAGHGILAAQPDIPPPGHVHR